MPSDTNRRIAEACGFVIYPHESRDCSGNLCTEIRIESGRWKLFDPEHDERDAVLAAEKYGLFMNRRNCHLTGLLLPGGKVGWAVWEGGEMIGSGTFCEAICGAILELDDKGREALRKDHNE